MDSRTIDESLYQARYADLLDARNDGHLELCREGSLELLKKSRLAPSTRV